MESRHSDLCHVKDNKRATKQRPRGRAVIEHPLSFGACALSTSTHIIPGPDCRAASLGSRPHALRSELCSRSRCCCRSGPREGGREGGKEEAYYGSSSNSARGCGATTARRTTGGRACAVLLRNIERVHFAPAEGGARTGSTTSFYADSVTAKLREAQQTALMAGRRVGPG